MRPFHSAAVLVLLALASRAGAQGLPIQVRLDAATFLYDDSQSLVEMYISFGASTLPFEAREDAQFEVAIPSKFRLLPIAAAAPDAAQREPVYEEDVTFTYVVEDTTAIQEGRVIVEQLRTAAPPGEYELAVTISLPDESPVQLRMDLNIPDYVTPGEPAMSSIQLASDIARAEEGDSFVKSGMRVVPNPDAFYGAGSPLVGYYAEVYRPPSDEDTYTVLAYVADGERSAPMEGLQSRSSRQVRPVDVVIGRLDVSEIPSGIYFLRLVVLNDASESVLEQSKRIYVINPDVERPSDTFVGIDHEDMLYAPMSGEELELNLEHARVLSTEAERVRIQELLGDDATDEDRRSFLAAFWRDRDTDPDPNVNNARRQFYRSLTIVNDRFREAGLPGFRSERGRVFLTYGPPSQVDRKPFTQEQFPYEEWTYENIPGNGRSIFIFIDRFTANQYELLHSNVRGELNNPDWEREVFRL